MCNNIIKSLETFTIRKGRYILEEQETIETLNHVVEEPEQGTSAQHKEIKRLMWFGKRKIH